MAHILPSCPLQLLLPSGPFSALEDPVTSLSSTPLLVSYQVNWVGAVSHGDLERGSKGISSVLGCPAHFAVGNLKPHLGVKVEPPPLHSTVLGPLRAAWLLPWESWVTAS